MEISPAELREAVTPMLQWGSLGYTAFLLALTGGAFLAEKASRKTKKPMERGY